MPRQQVSGPESALSRIADAGADRGACWAYPGAVENWGRNTQVLRMANLAMAATALAVATATSSGNRASIPTVRTVANAAVVAARLTPSSPAATPRRCVRSRLWRAAPIMPRWAAVLPRLHRMIARVLAGVAPEAGFEGGEEDGVGHGAHDTDAGEAEELVGEHRGFRRGRPHPPWSGVDLVARG